MAFFNASFIFFFFFFLFQTGLSAIFSLKDALKKAKPILLEPIMKVENITPDEFQGDITGDLNRRRARISGVETKGKLSTITAEVPLAGTVWRCNGYPLSL